MSRYLLFLFVLISCIFANPNIIIEKRSIFNDFEVLYIKDNTSKLKIEDISKKEFTKTTPNNFTLGYNKGKIWMKFTLENKSINQDFILTINESFYEIANLYTYYNSWIKKSNGVFTPIEKRAIKTNHLAFDITLKPKEKRTFYLELKGKYAYFGNIELYEKSYFYFDNTIGINTLYFFILGVISVIVIFNLFLYLKTKEKIYIYYVGYSFFNIIYILNISGLLVYLNLQEYIYDLHLSASFMIGFLLLFSNEYFETKKYLPSFYKILKFLSIPFFILGFLVVFSYQPWNKFINNFAGLICIFLIVVSIVIYLKGHNKTKYYIFAMLLYFTFVILFTFMVNGTFEYTNFTRYGFLIASAIEVIMFSFMLANRYNEMKENIQLYLEIEVENRTNKLSTLLQERELLLKEVYHRVKNNFHVIIGMIWFQSRKKDNDQLKELINRIKSMSMIHEYLYNSKDLTSIHVKEYLNKIISNISSSYENIILYSDIDDTIVEFDDAVSLGIIINEIFTNAIKHNSNKKEFYIKIKLSKVNGMIELVIEDNGYGFDTNIQTKGLGLKLVDQFCNKLLNSKYSFFNENGTKFELNFENRKVYIGK